MKHYLLVLGMEADDLSSACLQVSNNVYSSIIMLDPLESGLLKVVSGFNSYRHNLLMLGNVGRRVGYISAFQFNAFIPIASAEVSRGSLLVDLEEGGLGFENAGRMIHKISVTPPLTDRCLKVIEKFCRRASRRAI